nr:MAG TPA: hypothetical protein [Caudoviricetes sp.]
MPIHVFLSAFAYLKGGYYAFNLLKNCVLLRCVYYSKAK